MNRRVFLPRYDHPNESEIFQSEEIIVSANFFIQCIELSPYTFLSIYDKVSHIDEVCIRLERRDMGREFHEEEEFFLYADIHLEDIYKVLTRYENAFSVESCNHVE